MFRSELKIHEMKAKTIKIDYLYSIKIIINLVGCFLHYLNYKNPLISIKCHQILHLTIWAGWRERLI